MFTNFPKVTSVTFSGVYQYAFCIILKGGKADSVYPGYGDNAHNQHNPEDTVAIQPIPSR